MPFSRATLPLLFLLFFAAPALGSLSESERIEATFQPFRNDQATLSPDGLHLAYTVRESVSIYLAIVEVDQPEKIATVWVDHATLRARIFGRAEPVAQITFLRWATPNRLIYGVDNAVIYAVDADGKNLLKLVDAHRLEVTQFRAASGGGGGKGGKGGKQDSAGDSGGRPITFQRFPRVVAMPPQDPGHIIVEARSTRERGLFKVDIFTGALEELDAGPSVAGADLLYDRQGRPRIVLQRPGNDGSRAYRCLPARPGGWTGWRDLDSLLGGKASLGFRITPENYLGERAIPIGFDSNPDILYYASNFGRDTYGLYGLDLAAKKRTPFVLENATFDLADLARPFSQSMLVFDARQQNLVGVRFPGAEPATQWLDSDLAQVEALLESKFVHRSVDMIEWDDARTRFLLRVSRPEDPGRYYIYNRSSDRLVQFMRRAPWLEAASINAGASFSFLAPTGIRLSGYLTFPRAPRISPPPLLVYCHDGPWSRDLPGYEPEVQALAEMGFVVLQVNYRGSAGFGTAHRLAIRSGFDSVPLEDFLDAIGWTAAQHPIDRRRIALLGRGFGGYLALRALQLHPEIFRCAIAVAPVADLAAWRDQRVESSFRPGFAAMGPKGKGGFPSVPSSGFDFNREVRRWFFGKDTGRLEAISPLRQPELITKPVFLIEESGFRGVAPEQAEDLRSALVRRGAAPEFLDTAGDFARGDSPARFQIFTRIEDFLNLNVYDYRVEIGEPREKAE